MLRGAEVASGAADPQVLAQALVADGGRAGIPPVKLVLDTKPSLEDTHRHARASAEGEEEDGEGRHLSSRPRLRGQSSFMVSSGRGFSCEVFFNASAQKMAIFLSAFPPGPVSAPSLDHWSVHSLRLLIFAHGLPEHR